MRRLRKWLVVLTVLLLALVVAALLAYRLLLPSIVHRQLMALLREHGLTPAELTVAEVSLVRTQLTNITIGASPKIRVDRVKILYTPASLRQRRFTDIYVDGAELTITLADGQLDLGVLQPLLEPPNDRERRKTQPEAPMNRLEMSGATVHLMMEGQRLDLPFSVVVADGSAGRVSLDARTRWQGASVSIEGRVATTGDDAVLTVIAEDLQWSALAAIVSPHWLAPVAGLEQLSGADGRINLQLIYDHAADTRLAVHANLAEGRFDGIVAEQPLKIAEFSAHAALDFNSAFELGRLSLQFQSERLHWADRRLRDLTLELARGGVGESLQGKLTAGEPGVWRIDELRGSMTDPISLFADGRLEAHVSLRGVVEPLPFLEEVLKDAGIDLTVPQPLAGTAQLQITAARADSRWAWWIGCEQVDLRLRGAEVTAPAQGTIVGQTAMRIGGSAGIDSAGHWTARVDEAVVSIDTIVCTTPDLEFTASGSPALRIEADTDTGINLTGQWRDVFTWAAAFSDITFTQTAPADVNLPQRGVVVTAMTGDATLSGAASSEEASLTLLGESSWRAGQLSVFDLVGMALPRLVLSPVHEQPLLTWRRGGHWRSASHVKIHGQDLKVRAGGADIAIASAGATATAALAHDAAPSVIAALEINGGDVRHADSGVVLADLDAVIPLRWNAALKAADQSAGEFKVGRLQWQDRALPGFNGTVAVDQRQVRFAAQWPLIEGGVLTIRDTLIDFGSGEPTGRIIAQLPPMRITDDRALAKLIGLEQDIEFTGIVGLDIDLVMAGWHIEPRIQLHIADATVTSSGHDAKAEGLSADLLVESLAPLTSPGDQRLNVRQLSMSDFNARDVALAFRVEDRNSVLIEHLDATWSGGEVYSHAFRLRWDDPTIELTLYFHGLQLESLLAELVPDKAAGDGLVYGKLPIRLRWPLITFGEGFLYVPMAGGHLELKDAAALGEMLEENDPRFRRGSSLGDVRERIEASLRDFRYDRLRMDFFRRQGALVASLTTSGVGRVGTQMQEIGQLTVNISGIDVFLSRYLGLQSMELEIKKGDAQ